MVLNSVQSDVGIVPRIGKSVLLAIPIATTTNHIIAGRHLVVDNDRSVECARRRRTLHTAFMLVISSDMLLVSHSGVSPKCCDLCWFSDRLIFSLITSDKFYPLIYFRVHPDGLAV